ncbi:MAG: hypothetical protein ACYC3X_18480 [Pirellulaceae bacterium]
MIWTPESVGNEYYVRQNERASRIGRVAELVGESSILNARQLPTTVGAFCWKSDDDRAVFVDLVNYDWDAAADRVTPVNDLSFSIRCPAGVGEAEVITLSPDSISPATVELKDDWLEVRLPQLHHFASVKITLR